MSVLDNYESADQAFRTKAVLSQDNETLLTHLHGLSNQNNTNTGTQHRDIIRGITLNHILLQRHIDRLDKQNTKTQRLVIALTVAALLSGIPQIWLAYRADIRAETEQKPLQPNNRQTHPRSYPHLPINPRRQLLELNHNP